MLQVSAITQAPVDQTEPTTAAPSPTGKSLDKKLNNQINQLKEKIASRVSELNLVEKRGIIGVVTGVAANQITLTDVAGNTRFVDVDEITKYSSGSKTFDLSDITKGTKISILGLYNKQSKRILARFIATSVDPIFVNGAVTSLDSKNFTLVLTTPEQKQTKIDIENITKISDYDKEGTPTRSGFSQLAVGDRLAIIGFPDKTDSTLLVASRIMVFPDLPKDPKIVLPDTSNATSSADQTLSPTQKVAPTR